MKLLMLHAKEFWYKPYTDSTDATKSDNMTDAVIAFIHVEEKDMNGEEVIDKAVGNLRWLAKKNETDKIVLHSFAHLSKSKSNPETANKIIQTISEKLKKNFAVHIVPFGHFYEFSIHVLGPSLAKVFKDL